MNLEFPPTRMVRRKEGMSFSGREARDKQLLQPLRKPKLTIMMMTMTLTLLCLMMRTKKKMTNQKPLNQILIRLEVNQTLIATIPGND